MRVKHFQNKSLKDIKYVKNGVKYTEQWLPIFGYEAHYKISNLGRVKSIDRYIDISYCKRKSITKLYNSVIKSQTSHYKNKYFSVLLKVNGEEKRVFVHRLVAEHFIENKENKSEVNHKLGNKEDNRFFMLEWMTPKENTNHSIDSGFTKHRKAVCVKGNGVYREFKSETDCALFLGVNNSWVSKCAREGKEIKGFKISII